MPLLSQHSSPWDLTGSLLSAEQDRKVTVLIGKGSHLTSSGRGSLPLSGPCGRHTMLLDTLGIWAICVPCLQWSLVASLGLPSEHFQLWPTLPVPDPVTHVWRKLPCTHFFSTSLSYESMMFGSVTCVPGRGLGHHVVQLSHSSGKKTEA